MVDYTHPTGAAGTLIIRDDGWTVSFLVANSSGATHTGGAGWSGTINNTGVGGSFAINGAQTVLVGAWGVSASQWVTFGIADTGTQGLGGPASFGVWIPRATVPAAPTPLGIDEITPTSLRYRFSGNSDGGSSIIEWQAQLATDAAFTQNVRTLQHPTSGTHTFTGLLPGQRYYLRSRGRNGVGWGSYSSVLDAKTLSGFKHWNGTTWQSTELRTWNGSAWQLVELYAWNGSEWKACG